jgi:hypothetical protein
MPNNRISPFYGQADEQRPEAPPGFIAVPCAQLPLAAQHLIQRNQDLYQLAFAQALAGNRPAELDDDWFAQ